MSDLQLFNDLNTKYKCGEPFNIGTLSALDIFLDNLKKSYEMIGLEKLGDYEYKLDDTRGFNITMCKLILARIDETTISEISEKPKIDIYFNITIIDGIKYYNAILITPNNIGCNHLGLPERYIPSGIFVCKLLEYIRQDNGNLPGRPFTDKYNFVGDSRKMNEFPFITDEDGNIQEDAQRIIDSPPNMSSCCNDTSASASMHESMYESMSGKTARTGGKRRSKKIRQQRKLNKNKRTKRHNKKKTIKRCRF